MTELENVLYEEKNILALTVSSVIILILFTFIGVLQADRTNPPDFTDFSIFLYVALFPILYIWLWAKVFRITKNEIVYRSTKTLFTLKLVKANDVINVNACFKEHLDAGYFSLPSNLFRSWRVEKGVCILTISTNNQVIRLRTTNPTKAISALKKSLKVPIQKTNKKWWHL